MLAPAAATDTVGPELALIVFCRLEGQPYGLPMEVVERVVPMVEISRLPSAPSVLLGMIDYHGEVLPVVDVRARFGRPARESEVSQRLLIVRTPRRKLALRVDEVLGIRHVTPGRLVDPATLHPGLQGVDGIAVLEDGLVVIQDVEALISAAEEQALAQALDSATEAGEQ